MAWLLHFHGVLALLVLYCGYRLRRSLLESSVETRKRGERFWANAVLAGVVGVFATGVALYARYRSPGGARDWLVANAPGWHEIWFEWKEHLGLFSLLCALGLWGLARSAPGPRRTAAAFPLLATLLATLLVTTGVGTILSFFVRSVA